MDVLGTIAAAVSKASGGLSDAASYCIGSLLWSAFFFILGYLTALGITALRDRRASHNLGSKRRDHT